MRHLRPYYRFLAPALTILHFFSSCSAATFPNSFPPLNGTKANSSIYADMPGCSCQGHWCRDEEKTHFSYTNEELDHVAACPFLKGSAYGFFEDVVRSSGLICDELQASNDFRRAYGDLGNTGSPDQYSNSYYNVGQHLIRVESGNCETVYERQQQCGVDSKSYYSTARWYAPHPTNCNAWDYELPTTNKTLKIAPVCLSSFAKVDNPEDDRWLLYASWSNNEEEKNVDFCMDGTHAEELLQNRSSYPYFPILNREDWIEPIQGRRYVGYDFVDDRANDYCLFVMSLGYEPCHGSPTTSSSSNLSSLPIWALVVATSMIALR